MQNEQNQDRLEPNHQHTLMNSSPQREENVAAIDISDDQQQSGTHLAFPERNWMFSNQIDFLAGESFHTIQRSSLKVVPESLQFDFHSADEQDLASTLKSSHNSQIFQEQGSAENQLALIRETSELTLKQCATSIQYQGYNDNEPIQRVNKRHTFRVQHIKSAKQLIKQLKRQHKYNNLVTGDGILSTQDKVIKFKSATFKPIIDQKRHLSAIIIVHDAQQYKIQVVNRTTGYFDPELQLWNKQGQTWNQLSFRIKLNNL